MSAERALEARWIRLMVGHKRGRAAAVAHRVVGRSTACGYLISDRAVMEDRPPPGTRCCLICAAAYPEERKVGRNDD